MTDFQQMREQNVSRLARWHGETEWSLADWSNAMCGEAGEAANVVKKIRRIETSLTDQQRWEGDGGLAGMDVSGLMEQLAYELADTIRVRRPAGLPGRD